MGVKQISTLKLSIDICICFSGIFCQRTKIFLQIVVFLRPLSFPGQNLKLLLKITRRLGNNIVSQICHVLRSIVGMTLVSQHLIIPT